MKSNDNYRVLYLLIVFFIIMIFIPPLLRLFLPNEQIIENTPVDNSKQEFISRNLRCDFNQTLGDKNIKVNIFTSYYNQEITSIVFTYDISAIEDNNLFSTFSIFKELDELKTINGVEYSKNDLVETIAITSKEIISNEPKLQKYSQNIDVQKAYYENLGFMCDVVK